MSGEPEPELIKRTQSSLTKFIKEPPLTEKLLKKPPFRFLQDIVKSIIKETGYLRDVFSDEELLENAKDKEKKIAFLKKIISAVQDTTGKTTSVKPNKIVAGLEVSKTLELLQLLASAVSLQKSGEAKTVALKAAEKAKTIATHNGSPSTITDTTKKSRSKRDSVTSDGSPASANKEAKKKSGDHKTEKSGKSEKKAKTKEDDKGKDKASKTAVEGDRGTVKSKERPSSRRKSIQEPLPPTDLNATPTDSVENEQQITLNGPTSSVDADETKPEERDIESTNKFVGKEENGEVNQNEERSERKTSARRSSSKTRLPSSKTRDKPLPVKATHKEKQAVAPILGTDDVSAQAPKIERPKTARKAPPSARPASARSGIPKMKDRGEVKTDLNQTNETEAKPVAVITELEPAQDEENLVVIEAQPLSLDIMSEELGQTGPIIENEHASEGALVAQILETKKEMDENKQIWSTIGGGPGSGGQKVEIDWEGGRKQKKEAWAKEMNRLRDGIQQLTRSANPLGKLFDFLQEDVDSMQRELKMWIEANANYHRQLEDERRLTDESLESYRRKLAELDNLIEEEHEAVRTIRASVLANDKRLMCLVSRSD